MVETRDLGTSPKNTKLMFEHLMEFEWKFKHTFGLVGLSVI